MNKIADKKTRYPVIEQDSRQKNRISGKWTRKPTKEPNIRQMNKIAESSKNRISGKWTRYPVPGKNKQTRPLSRQFRTSQPCVQVCEQVAWWGVGAWLHEDEWCMVQAGRERERWFYRYTSPTAATTKLGLLTPEWGGGGKGQFCKSSVGGGHPKMEL